MNNWNQIPSDEVIEEVVKALATNNIEAFVAETSEEAKKKFFELIPEGSSVFTNTSATLNQLGIAQEINESGKYDSLKNKVATLPSETAEQQIEKRQFGSAMSYAVGSVHAVTSDGKLLIASGTGSQLPGYVYGADHVVWVVGAQKLVKDIDSGLKRIYEHTLPLESARINEMYKTTAGSNPRRILIFNSEGPMNKDRTKLIIVKEVLGF